MISSPPIPAITTESASPGRSFATPSESLVSILSASPARAIFSVALDNGPFRTSIATAFFTIVLLTSSTGTCPWSVPTSAADSPGSTNESTSSRRSDNFILISPFLFYMTAFRFRSRLFVFPGSLTSPRSTQTDRPSLTAFSCTDLFLLPISFYSSR